MIDFEVLPDDAVAFADFHWQSSPTLLRQYRRTRYDLALGIVLFGLATSVFSETPTGLLIGVVGAVAWVLLVPVWLSTARRRSILSLYREGANRATFGVQCLTVTPAGLQVESGGSRSLEAWPTVERVAETADHVFIYTSAVSALVVPKRAIRVGSLVEFTRDLEVTRGAAAG